VINSGRMAAIGAGLVVGVLIGLLLSAMPAFAQEAPVAAADLPRGTVLAAEHVAPPVDSAVLGWVTRRTVSKGEPLRAPAVAPPDLVKSGEVVRLVWRQGGIEIQLVGKAMGSAGKGETVQVRVDSKRRFAGVVEGPGLVRMDAKGNQR
jgi:flagellar basal body P-ring formation protein FlgA